MGWPAALLKSSLGHYSGLLGEYESRIIIAYKGNCVMSFFRGMDHGQQTGEN